ncbi:MAG: ferrochelatase [Proteobacteria bacterium]|jgi:protoporphyrin/coproporphyrin ferrochelatase|nr:ferrochelatase [Pseudomonadota bacterium]
MVNNYYGSNKDFGAAHERTAVLITNLGTPDRPVCPGLRKYLAEFLSDPRVVEFPRILWKIILNVIIINFRSPKSAAAYRKVWTEQGSPLLVASKHLTENVNRHLGEDQQAFLAMRYGNPSIEKTLKAIHDEGYRKLIVLPMYPQYSASTSASTFDAIAQTYTKQRWLPSFSFISEYHQHPAYIEAIANSILEHWKSNTKSELLLFSFHGIPQRYISNGDPYAQHCETSSRLIAEALGLKANEWQLVYQSRFGREPWLQPYCDKTLQTLPDKGIKSVDVICPGFSVDCLETLEEIDQENRAYFLDSGGTNFNYIPCLNDSDVHAKLICELIEANR